MGDNSCPWWTLGFLQTIDGSSRVRFLDGDPIANRLRWFVASPTGEATSTLPTRWWLRTYPPSGELTGLVGVLVLVLADWFRLKCHSGVLSRQGHLISLAWSKAPKLFQEINNLPLPRLWSSLWLKCKWVWIKFAGDGSGLVIFCSRVLCSHHGQLARPFDIISIIIIIKGFIDLAKSPGAIINQRVLYR